MFCLVQSNERDSFTQGVTDEGIYLYVQSILAQSPFSVHSLAQSNFLQGLLSVSGNREWNGNHFETLSLVLAFSKTNT